MAPPVLSRKDPITGHLIKRKFPQATWLAFRLLAKLRVLRGGPLDLFGKSSERRLERQLVTDFESDIELILSKCNDSNRSHALGLARAPETVKGFGHVKLKHIRTYQNQRRELIKRIKQPDLSLIVNQG